MQFDLFEQLKTGISNLDPVTFCEQNLTLSGEKFTLHGNGYKPFADIYRQIGINSLKRSQDSKPIVLVKGRQVGATTMAAALEFYFMASGLFGRGNKPPIRIIHAFPTLVHVHLYAKTKFNPMMKSAKAAGIKKNGRHLSIIEAKLDKTSPTNDSLQFKQFEGENFVRIESTGLNADRLRGGTVDAIFYDECFPYSQNIVTVDGILPIGKLYDLFVNGDRVPEVLSYNERSGVFEYKKVVNGWNRGERDIWQLTVANKKIKCTNNHRFLTNGGWKQLIELKEGDLIKSITGIEPIIKIENISSKECVYDIEVLDNHNFIVDNLVAHNCQDVPQLAIANANKLLSASLYGKPTKGVQVYFGTPKQRNSKYYEMWMKSTQNYYFLGCEKCGEYFPLYTPGSNDWEKIWITGFMVQCTHCQHVQDKLEAAERGKWISTRDEDDPDVDLIGYHINQFYNPQYTREDIENEKPENSIINTERAWMNEVLGEFYTGDTGPITKEEIITLCGDSTRPMRASVSVSEGARVFAGFDWGKRNDEDVFGKAEVKRSGGQSYSTCVVLKESAPGLLEIIYAGIVKKNDNEYKRSYIHEVMRKYSVTQAVGDIGFAHELTEDMHREYNNRFLGCELVGHVNGYIRINEGTDTIQAQREYHIEEVFNIMRRGMIRFPLGGERGENSGFDRVSWLIDHCASMEVKTTFNVVHEPVRRYVKGSTPNDGMMALVNAYIAYKYINTGGFSEKRSIFDKKKKHVMQAVGGYCPKL